MNETQMSYKVLWVDDDNNIIESFCLLADDAGIDMDVASDWETAEQKLKTNFEEYSAIILDANCKLKKNDSLPSERFLGDVTMRLSSIFGEKHRLIPWYVLSAGTMKNFGTVMELISTEEREQMSYIWGDLIYFKDDVNDTKSQLFENIINVASQKGINVVLSRHREVLQYLGDNNLISYNKARTYIIKMLSALYFPEDNLNFSYEGNPLRKVVEYLFRTANKYGLLPNACFDSSGHVVLLDASRYMAGKEMNCYENRALKYKMRYGDSGDSIFNKEIAGFVKNILNYSNGDSHTDETDPYVIEADKIEVFFGYVLQLCHVIKWFGKYVEEHPDKEVNQSFQKIIDVPETNQKVENNGKSLIGKTKAIMCNNEGKPVWGDVCKLSAEYKSEIGKSAILKNVDTNTDKDAQKYPYIAIELEILN